MKRLIITEEEKRDIVKLYYKNSIILEQTGNQPVNAKIVFSPGLYELKDAQGMENLKTQIENLKSRLAQRTDKNYITKIVLTAGESQIKNQKGFEKQGSLAAARLNTVSNYLKSLNIPQISIETNTKIGKTTYNGPEDLNPQGEKMKLFTAEQFFSVQIFIETRTEVFVRDFIIMKYNYDSGNPKQVGRWVTTTFNGTKGVNNIIDQTNYDYLTQNLVNNKLYTPENLYQIISNNLGEKNNSTAQSWGDIGIKPKNNYGMYYRVKIFGIKSGQDVGYTQQYMKQENQTLTLTPEQITNLTSNSQTV
jgi:hypothetical protein